MKMDAEKSRKLADWLRNESEDRMKKAMSRKGYASVMENATEQELCESKSLAEKMSGRKLDLVSTSKKSATDEALIQVRIASKLEVEANQLSTWADDVLACTAEAEDVEARLAAEREKCKAIASKIGDDWEHGKRIKDSNPGWDIAAEISYLGPTTALDELLAKARLEEGLLWNLNTESRRSNYGWNEVRLSALREAAKGGK